VRDLIVNRSFNSSDCRLMVGFVSNRLFFLCFRFGAFGSLGSHVEAEGFLSSGFDGMGSWDFGEWFFASSYFSLGGVWPG